MSPSAEVVAPSRLTNALAESKAKSVLTAVAVWSPVLHTRAPTGKVSGPVAGELLSRPTTFHVRGVIVRMGDAWAGPVVRAPSATTAPRSVNSPRHENLVRPIGAQ